MYKQILSRMSTIVHSVEDAEKYSPFRLWHNPNSDRWVVSKVVEDGKTPVAAGMDKEEAEACLLVKANEFVIRNMK